MEVTFTPEQVRQIIDQTAKSLEQLSGESGAPLTPNKVKCWSCRIGLNIGIGASIAIAVAAWLASDDIPSVTMELIQAVTFLTEAVITQVFHEAVTLPDIPKDVERVIYYLCQQMGACE